MLRVRGPSSEFEALSSAIGRAAEEMWESLKLAKSDCWRASEVPEMEAALKEVETLEIVYEGVEGGYQCQ